MESDAGSCPEAQQLCGVCAREVSVAEEHLSALCNACGSGVYHVDCVTPMMDRIHHDSTRAMERARRMISKQPDKYMAEQRMRCPKAIKAQDASECSGRIVEAELVKPSKAAPAPPPGLPPPPPRAKQKRGGSTGGGGNTAAPHAAPPPLSKRQQREQQRAAAAALRAAAAPDYASTSAGGGAGRGPRDGGAPPGGKLRFPPGHRPVELQPCKDWDECGECFLHRCPRCHGPEELAERERQWVAKQETKKRQARQEELARHEAAVAARAEQSPWLDQVAARELERIEHEEAYLQMSDASLRLMKEHKRSSCVAQLIDMGFPASRATAAANAAAADVSSAAALLMEGGLVAGSKPVSVTGEAQELLAYAASLGLGLREVEMCLVIAGGDGDEARLQLHQQAEAAATAASAAEAAAAATAAAAAGSREEAELEAALAASASSAAMAYNTSRAAAEEAARAAEEADLAAALEASRAEEAARQRTLAFFLQPASLPWAAQQPEAARAASSSAAAAESGGWGMRSADAAGWVASLSAAGAHWAASPGRAGAGWGDAGLGGSGGGWAGSQPVVEEGRKEAGRLQFYNASAKQSMPEYRGGWDVGPAAIAAVTGRSSQASSLAPAAPDPWQPPLKAAGSVESSAAQPAAGLHGGLPHADSASSISGAPSPQGAAAAQAAGAGWGAAPAQRPVSVTASFAHPTSFAALPLHHHQQQQQQAASGPGAPTAGGGSSWGVAAAVAPLTPGTIAQQQQQQQQQQQPDDAAELDELMQLMGI